MFKPIIYIIFIENLNLKYILENLIMKKFNTKICLKKHNKNFYL